MNTRNLTMALFLTAGLHADAALFQSGALPGLTIPDNITLGTGNTLGYTLNEAGALISDLSLSFSLKGGFSSDLSAYLRLGNQADSPFYDLTSLVRSQSLISVTPTTYSIGFTDPGFKDAFIGHNPNNTWTLFFADTAPLGSTTVENWSLEITAVPEPVNVALGIFGAAAAIIAVRKRFLTAHR